VTILAIVGDLNQRVWWNSKRGLTGCQGRVIYRGKVRHTDHTPEGTLSRAQRTIRAALRTACCSPEDFAAQYGRLTGDASGRTVRRWVDGHSTPHPLVVVAILNHFTRMRRERQ